MTWCGQQAGMCVCICCKWKSIKTVHHKVKEIKTLCEFDTLSVCNCPRCNMRSTILSTEQLLWNSTQCLKGSPNILFWVCLCFRVLTWPVAVPVKEAARGPVLRPCWAPSGPSSLPPPSPEACQAPTAQPYSRALVAAKDTNTNTHMHA